MRREVHEEHETTIKYELTRFKPQIISLKRYLVNKLNVMFSVLVNTP